MSNHPIAEYLHAVLCQRDQLVDALDADYNDPELRAQQIEVEKNGGRPPGGRVTRIVCDKEAAEKLYVMFRAARAAAGSDSSRVDTMKLAHQNLMDAATSDYENRVDPLAAHGKFKRVCFNEHAQAAEAIMDLSPQDRNANEKKDKHDLPTIIYHGEKAYSISEWDPISVTDLEDVVLQQFLEVPSMDKATLVTRCSENVNAPRTLADLKKRYQKRFAPAIKLAGGKGKGGYFVRISKSKA